MILPSKREVLSMIVGAALLFGGLWALSVNPLLQPQPAVGWAQPPTPRTTVDGELTPLGFHQYTSLSSATDLSDGGTFTVPTGAYLAWIQAEDQNVRWRDATYASGDTTDPTASVGMIIFAGDSIWYNGNLKAIEFIEEAASAKLNVSFYGL